MVAQEAGGVGEGAVQGSLDFFPLYLSDLLAYRANVIIKLCVTIAVVEEGKHIVDREESKRVQNAVHAAEVWRRESGGLPRGGGR